MRYFCMCGFFTCLLKPCSLYHYTSVIALFSAGWSETLWEMCRMWSHWGKPTIPSAHAEQWCLVLREVIVLFLGVSSLFCHQGAPHTFSFYLHAAFQKPGACWRTDSAKVLINGETSSRGCRCTCAILTLIVPVCVCVCVKWSQVNEKKLLDKDWGFSSDHSICWLSQ